MDHSRDQKGVAGRQKSGWSRRKPKGRSEAVTTLKRERDVDIFVTQVAQIRKVLLVRVHHERGDTRGDRNRHDYGQVRAVNLRQSRAWNRSGSGHDFLRDRVALASSEGGENQESLGRRNWRRGSGSNRRIKVLQTSPLPLGYRAL